MKTALQTGVLVDARKTDHTWFPAWGRIDRYDGEGFYRVRPEPCRACGQPAGASPLMFHEDDLRPAENMPVASGAGESAGRAFPRDKAAAIIAFLREAFRNYGAEGESVHAICDAYESEVRSCAKEP